MEFNGAVGWVGPDWGCFRSGGLLSRGVACRCSVGGWGAGGWKVTVQEVLSWLFRGRSVEDGLAVDWGWLVVAAGPGVVG